MLVYWLLVGGLYPGIWGQSADDIAGDLLPRPREIVVGEGSFAFSPADLKYQITAATVSSAEHLADRLIEGLTEFGIPHPPRAACQIAVSGSKGTFALQISLDGTPLSIPEWNPPEASREGYQLRVTDQGLAIAAASEPGLFYGIQTLLQLLDRKAARHEKQIRNLEIRDWPAIGMRGYSEDYGRNQLPTIEDHKRSIRFLAHFKANTYLWFIEPDHFVYKFDATIGQDYDRFTFEEIRELVAYARQYHVEVIPTVELLGHMEMLLRHPKYRHLAEVEGGSDLCATCEDAFDLVRKVVGEIAPAFESRYFHCGLDESFAIGKGRSAQAVKERGLERVMADYYTRMNDLIKSHGKTMMMYADIVLTHPGIIDRLPKDIVMMFWDYNPRERYTGMDQLHQAGLPLTSLSTLWDWRNLYPVYTVAVRNIDTLARQSKELNVMGHFVSSWGDPFPSAGGMNLSEVNSYGVAYCAAKCWNLKPIELTDYSRAFAARFYGDSSVEIAEALRVLAECQGDRLFQARRMFQTDPLITIRGLVNARAEDIAFWQKLQESTQIAIAGLKTVHPLRNADYLHSVELCAQMLQLGAELALACRAVGASLGKPDSDGDHHAKMIEELAARQRSLWHDYRRVYLATNRPINITYIQKEWDQTHAYMIEAARQLRSGKLTTEPSERK